MRIFVIAIILAGGLLLWTHLSQAKQIVSPVETSYTPTVTPDIKTVEVSELKRTIFVPYWNIPTDSDDLALYDREVYFGLAVTAEGLDRSDEGYSRLSTFMNLDTQKEKAITLRMLDTATNTAILEDPQVQKSIINETVSLLSELQVDELVLDLEMSVLPITDVREHITEFTRLFANELHENNMRLSMTIYGDTIYRGRPYDLQTLGKHVDEFYLMTYDFHKVHGEPGPNFPYAQEKAYPYSYQTMLKDMLVHKSPSEITVILGMYGYDWTLGAQGLPLKAAKALSLKDIKLMLGDTCELQQCKLSKTPQGKEPAVSYKDAEGYAHIIWFEDEESAQKKIEYMQQQGISNVAYWVWGYF